MFYLRKCSLWTFFLSLLLTFLFSVHSTTTKDGASTSKLHEAPYVANFDRLYSLSRRFVSSTALPYFDSIVNANLNISAVCQRTLRKMVKHPESEWASLMLDASGRIIRPGFLSGTITDYGDYDQCMAIRGRSDRSLLVAGEAGAITARYCLLTLRTPVPPNDVILDFRGTPYEGSWPARAFATPRNRFYWRLTSGLCFPTLCHQSEVEAVFRKVFEDFDLRDVTVGSCQVAGAPAELDFAQLLSIAILATCSAAVVIGTLVDARVTRKEAKMIQNQAPADQRPVNFCRQKEVNAVSKERTIAFWRSFSLLKTLPSLFSIHEPPVSSCSGSELRPVHGLRVLLISWVIICHSTNFAPLGLYDQPMIAARFAEDIAIVRSLPVQFVINGGLSVQAFFIISGLISLHTALKNRKVFQQSVPYWKYLLLRWTRFAPPLIGMFTFQFLWPLLGSGPLMTWDFLKYGHEPCYRGWWTNLLLVSNWWPLTEQCGSHTWFLSADFQINLVAYFFILLYVYDFRLGLRANAVALVVALLLPTAIHWWYEVGMFHIMEPDVGKLNVAFNLLEFNTYNHFAAYFAGLFVAGLLNSEDGKLAWVPSRSFRLSAWWTATAIVTLLPFATYPFVQLDTIPTNLLTISHTGVKRALWIGAISWIIFATVSCSKNSLVAQFLSAKFWQPLSRLTFSIYLVQSLVVWYYAYQGRSLHWISHYNAIFRIGGVALFSILSAILLYVLFEAPSVNLVKLALKSSIVSGNSCKKQQGASVASDPNNNVSNSSENKGLAEMTTLTNGGNGSEEGVEEEDEKLIDKK